MAMEEDLLADKGGGFNEGIPLDMKFLPWLPAFLAELHRGRPSEAPLWPFSHEMMLKWFHMAVAEAKLEKLDPELYSLRHGGVSHDLGCQYRDMLSIKQRGRWKSDASLRRYQKHSRVQAELNKLTADQRAQAQWMHDHIELAFRCPHMIP